MNTMEDRFTGVWSQTYVQKLLFKLAMVLVIIGALNWLFICLFDFNLVTVLFGHSALSSTLYFLIGISALLIMFQRDTYLPFLGPTLVPCSILQNREPPGATKEVKVIVTPNTKVLYWAAEPANEKLKTIQSWKEAYDQYENAGVTTSNGEGVAVLKVRNPQSYKVPFKGRLEAHVHYRVCGEAGWVGRVNTVQANIVEPEGFEDQQTDKNVKGRNLADYSASIY